MKILCETDKAVMCVGIMVISVVFSHTQGEQGGPGQKGSKGDKGEGVSVDPNKCRKNVWTFCSPPPVSESPPASLCP